MSDGIEASLNGDLAGIGSMLAASAFASQQRVLGYPADACSFCFAAARIRALAMTLWQYNER
jgi:hypothetical protein